MIAYEFQYFENVSRNMVVSGGKCPGMEKHKNFKSEVAKVFTAFTKKRDSHDEYKKQWAPYLNDALNLWQEDYMEVWSLYVKGKL